MMIISLYHPPSKHVYIFINIKQPSNNQYTFDTLITASPELFLQYNWVKKVAAYLNTIKPTKGRIPN